MLINGISCSVPDVVVTNDDILEKFEEANRSTYGSSLDEMLTHLKENFSKSGIETRRYLDNEEPWFHHVKQAIDSAVSQADIAHKDIDCIIYGSVFRTVLEPSMASLIAKALGLRYVSAFDVNEACASWIRTMSLANDLLASGRYKRILVVTSEANARWNGYGTKAMFETLPKKDDLEWAFATMTIGAAFTATIVSTSPEASPWSINHAADNSLAVLSIFPLDFPTSHDHDLGNEGIGVTKSEGTGPGLFSCFTEKLQVAAAIPFARFVMKDVDNIRDADIVIPHTQTYHPYLEMMDFLKVPREKLYSVYPKYGNLVSSSLPTGIADAIENGSLKRGDKAFLLIPASGLTMATCSFTY